MLPSNRGSYCCSANPLRRTSSCKFLFIFVALANVRQVVVSKAEIDPQDAVLSEISHIQAYHLKLRGLSYSLPRFRMLLKKSGKYRHSKLELMDILGVKLTDLADSSVQLVRRQVMKAPKKEMDRKSVPQTKRAKKVLAPSASASAPVSRVLLQRKKKKGTMTTSSIMKKTIYKAILPVSLSESSKSQQL